MKILYLDTSSSFLYCGLIEDDSILFEIKEKFGRDLSKNTLYRIKKEFDLNNLSPKSVDKIIVVNGPGSFTGIRIGVTIAKTFAWALNIPIITISSLEAMALSSVTEKNYIVPIIDARRGNVFGAIYDKNGKIIFNEKYIEFNDLKNKLEEYNSDYIFVSNDVFDFQCSEYLPNILKIVKKCMYYPEKEPHMVNANYLKLTEAEEKNNDKNN